MIFDRVPEICDKCGKLGNTWTFLSIEGTPKICENCIASVLFGKKLNNRPDYEQKYFNRPKKTNFWRNLVDK